MNEEDEEMLDDASASTVTGTVDQLVANSSVCDFECCYTHRNSPFQSLTSKSIWSSKRKQGKQHHVFQRKWFSEHKWLSYCLKRNVVYCFYCQKINSLGGLTFNKPSDSSFITKGFCNWKKGKEKF